LTLEPLEDRATPATLSLAGWGSLGSYTREPPTGILISILMPTYYPTSVYVGR
jgi:hypothetical protein